MITQYALDSKPLIIKRSKFVKIQGIGNCLIASTLTHLGIHWVSLESLHSHYIFNIEVDNVQEFDISQENILLFSKNNILSFRCISEGSRLEELELSSSILTIKSNGGPSTLISLSEGKLLMICFKDSNLQITKEIKVIQNNIT